MTAKTSNRAIARYVTAAYVAEHFSVSPNTVTGWKNLRFDPLPCVKLPGLKHPRFDMVEVQQWAERNALWS